MKSLKCNTSRLFHVIRLLALAVSLIPGLWSESNAQTPFICKGQSFITYEVAHSNLLSEMKMKNADGTVDLEYLGNLKTIINCIGYRSTDNLIYGFNPNTHYLYSIDSNYIARKLRHYELSKYQSFLAGDVSPDGRYFVMIGGAPLQEYGKDMDFIVIDLTDTTFPIVKKFYIPQNDTRIFDIAFDPTTEVLYGFDTRYNRLVTIDVETGNVVKRYPELNGSWIFGALFFDVYGNLRGYGTENRKGGAQNTLYAFDKETGDMKIIGKGQETWSSDGCSCPYTVGLQMSVANGRNCLTRNITLRIVHTGRDPVTSMTLDMPLPDKFIITGLSDYTGGTIKSGLKTNRLYIDNIDISKGAKLVKLEITMPAYAGVYELQAYLKGLPNYLGKQIVSDNTDTYAEGDAYILILKPPHVRRSETYRICEGETIELSSFYEGRLYDWTSGVQDTTILVGESGHYTARITRTCDTSTLDHHVEVSGVRVSLSPGNSMVKPFEILTIDGNVRQKGSGYLKYQWSSTAGNIPCSVCTGPFDINFSDPDTIRLKVVNDHGCSDSGQMTVEVDTSVAGDFFIPNAFSPNHDLRNDTFYIVGYGYLITTLQIYDRWGRQVYVINDKPSGFPEYGWTGYDEHDQDLHPNVYFYRGTLMDDRSHLTHVSGTVTLLK